MRHKIAGEVRSDLCQGQVWVITPYIYHIYIYIETGEAVWDSLVELYIPQEAP